MYKKYGGLSEREIEKYRETYGLNSLPGTNKKRWYILLLRQFKNVLVAILLVACIVSLVIGEFLNAAALFLVIIANAILGFIQEYKASHSLQALQNLTKGTVFVIRKSYEKRIVTEELVPNDRILLESGDIIPADAKLIEVYNLFVNEASITGESEPIEKSKTNNLIYSGTTVLSGKAVALITATGNNTSIAKIAGKLQTIKHVSTPLEKKVSYLGKMLTLVAFGTGFLIIIIGLFQNRSVSELILAGISLSVAAVPESLPAIITISLAIGLQRMARKHALLKRLDALESLGMTTVLLTDKTGTLTQNKMKVTSFSILDTPVNPYQCKHPDYTHIITALTLSNTTILTRNNNSTTVSSSDPIENSIYEYIQTIPKNIRLQSSNYSLIDERSFDASRKMTSRIYQQNNKKMVFSKGAFESILSSSKFYLKNGKTMRLTTKIKQRLVIHHNLLTQNGLRVLALSQKSLLKYGKNDKYTEKNMTFLGFIGIHDPPRLNVKDSISKALQAGIKTVMVTGDHKLTAQSIAREVGIPSEGEVIEGNEIKLMPIQTLSRFISNKSIFARITPLEKLKLVQAFQKTGAIVAVTGDGVNDVLALEQAHVGVAMGQTGTQVAKESADMVLLQDDYSTIIDAIEQGRLIFENIVKSITYLIATNSAEICTILFSTLLNLPIPLLPIHILWINLITDSIPAIAFAYDYKRSDLMHKPMPTKLNLIPNNRLVFIIISSLIITIVSLSIFVFFLQTTSLSTARFMVFNILVFSQLLLAYIISTKRHLIPHKKIILAIIVSIAIQLLVISIPLSRNIFLQQ